MDKTDMSENRFGKEFLGTGWSFPIQADPLSGRIRTVSQEEDIQQAIRLILMTRPGERVMRPEFGCRIYEYLFGTADYTSLSGMRHAVEEALENWEPRITEVNVNVRLENGESGFILIEIDYRVRTTNNPYNLVFPFYLNEGFHLD